MKKLAAVFILLSTFHGATAQEHQHAGAQTKPAQAQPVPVVLMKGMGNHHHPISTTNPEAQKFFDQGLVLMYGFNHPEAIRSFQKAAELDPKPPCLYGE